jgi:uncharacterized protein involved in type VI secretion and phage assembly
VTRLAEAIGLLARHEVARLRVCELGVVRSVYGADGPDGEHCCTVELRDTALVLPRVPIAVGITGSASLPAVGDLVAVLFAGGDLHAPLIVGRLYSDALAPPEHAAGQSVLRLPPGQGDAAKRLDVLAQAPSGSERLLTITVDGEAPVQIRVEPGQVRIGVGDAELTLRQPAGGAGQATLAVGDSRVDLDGNGDVSVQAAGTLTLRGAKVEVAAETQVSVKGQLVELN